MTQAPKVLPPRTTPTLESFCRSLCAELGEDFELQRLAPERLRLRGADALSIDVERHRDAVLFQASGWPCVEGLGLRRSFARTIAARISITREAAAAAQELRRRVLLPLRAALAQALREASAFRGLLDAVAESLQHCGLRAAEAHTIGRTLQARRPLPPLDCGGVQVPSHCALAITVQDQVAVASFEVRHLSLTELVELNGFVDTLMKRRGGQLRLLA